MGDAKSLLKTSISGMLAPWITKKTHLSKLQSKELASSLVHVLYTMNGLHFGRNKVLLRILFNSIDWKNFRLTEAAFFDALQSVSYIENYREPIGIWYTIDSEQCYADAPKVSNTGDVTYYASGREPFLAVAEQVAPARKVVLMPYFTCSTVYQPFIENNWQIVFYRVGKDLRIDSAHVLALYEAHKPALAVFMEYSGTDLSQEELQTVGKLKRSGCVTIVDRTQNIYSLTKAPEVDFYCGSLRKWFCCPDGAYLERNGDIPLPPAPPEGVCNDVYSTACAAMMFANGLLRERKIRQYRQIANFFLKLSAAYVCGQPVRLRNMSDYSRAVYLRQRDKDSLYTGRRMDNFRYIYDRIAEFTTVRPVCADIGNITSAPLYFHVYADDRTLLSRYLSEKGVITSINWMKPEMFDRLDADTEYIFQHILSLPCDQRYTLEDMKILCDALEAYENGHRKQTN